MRLWRRDVARRVRRSRIVTSNRLVLATSVLVAGLAAAWPFRHPKPPLSVAMVTQSGPDEPPLRRQEVRLEVSPLAESSPAVGLEQLSLKLRKAKNPAPEEPKPVGATLESLGSPPALGQMYESLMQPVDVSAEARASSPYSSNASTDSFASSSRAMSISATTMRPTQTLEDRRPTLREHRIVDGDSLQGLAQRYLGDSLRAEEIYELNRDRLRDPNILPVGKRLRIPQRGEPTLTPVARSN